ncbi:N-carbamoyl-L-amino acid hydrolase [Indibacter alkaliphilus LW1]|uniref:N-carbamoyl-L-amino acid hydrolase n=1 Tax=Indibacter alkaliphilus (strain CCUG 57479 / KCTC 22604 / LW1) TaxID=1189612 RepID=S2DGS1_INDAL|nr:Zn-dependent hydrolase [Indibacter alkaliphilus]EOZ98119.1 N-carbamoyl-L-amino acid hydrolase [Indibacter alkaliphilus LW1]
MKARLLSFSLMLISLVTIAQEKLTYENIRVNAERLEQRIQEYAKFGINEKGEPYRVAYSQGDIEGRAYFMELMKNAGLDVHIDFAGNIIGKREGKNSSKKPIAFGSHLDMVPRGGNYDGTLGSFTALEIIEVLNEHNITTDHPLEIMIFQNEEGGLVGSRALTGNLKTEALTQKSASGLTLEEGIRAIGGDPGRLGEVIRKKGDLAAFLEIHIEQSKVLESQGIDVAIVEGIVGIEDWDITVTGMANHAGSTPMNDRQDALIAASKLVLAVNEVVRSYDGAQVGSIGKISVPGGAPNIIPGRVEMSLQMRDLSTEKIMKMFGDIEKRADEIAKSTNTTVEFKNLNLGTTPTIASKEIQDKMERAAQSLGISFIKMQSGAGHDVQEMAALGPIGLIFIPSKEGISHNPKEYSSPSQMAKGADLMLHTLLSLDKH